MVNISLEGISNQILSYRNDNANNTNPQLKEKKTTAPNNTKLTTVYRV